MAHSMPVSLKGGPVTTNTLVRKRYILIYIALIWLSLLPVINSTAGYILKLDQTPLFILWYAPIIIVIEYFEFLFGSLFWSWLFLKIVNLFHHPQEGIFPRDPKNKDYRYWSLRAVIKKYAIWVTHNFPFPWADLIVFRMFGNKTSWKAAFFDAWIDAEFVSIGAGSMIGQGAVIQTSMLTAPDAEHPFGLLILKGVEIGNNCIVGAHSVLSPGTILEDNVVLGALSLTTPDQRLEANWIYVGRPAQKYHENTVPPQPFIDEKK